MCLQIYQYKLVIVFAGQLGDILLINDINSKRKFLAIAHDTGAAIRGRSRIDLFTGYGNDAERLASGLNKKISVNKLQPIAK